MNEAFINWPLWAATMVPLTLSAGPGNIMVATAGARSGLRRSMPFILGMDCTYFSIAIAVGLGLGEVLKSQPLISDVIKALGVCYIFFLAWKLWNTPPLDGSYRAAAFKLKDGVLVQCTNTKGIIMLVTMFSQFLAPASNLVVSVTLLSGALVFLNFSAHLLWVTFGATLSKAFCNNLRLLRLQNGIFALMMFSVGIWLALR